jgi:hypothetical protein
MERDAHNQGLLYIHLSKFPVKEPPSKFLTGAVRREMPITRAFYVYHLESPVKEPPIQVPLSEPQ